MRVFCVALTVILVILIQLASLLVQASPGVARQAHTLLAHPCEKARTATADAIQPDVLVLCLECRRGDKARGHRPRRVLIASLLPLQSQSSIPQTLSGRPGSRTAKIRRDQLAASEELMVRCGFEPWVIDFYRKAGRACKILPHEVMRLVATRAAHRLVQSRFLRRTRGDPAGG